MKKLTIGLTSLLFIFVAMPNLAFAQSESPAAEVQATTLMSSETDEEKVEQLKSRINEYKVKLKSKLSASESRRVVGACKAAQTLTAQVVNGVATVRENRSQKYGMITSRLSNMVAKLEQTSLDTSKLEESIAVLQSQIDLFNSSVDEYQILLNDLSEMDCTSNPDAFMSALILAKEKRDSLRAESQSIKKYVQENIKPELQSIKEQLNKISDTGEDQ